jgi:hypothetical protein
MQINVLGADRRRRWSYDEKVREETVQAAETVCGVARADSQPAVHPASPGCRRRWRQGVHRLRIENLIELIKFYTLDSSGGEPAA